MNSSLKYSLLATLIAVAIALGPLNIAAAGEITPELEAVMAQAGADQEISVIIQLKNKVNVRQFKKLKRKLRRNHMINALKQQARTDQSGIETLLKKKKGRKLRKLWLINGIAVRATADLIRQLSSHKAVEEIRLDAAVPLADTTTSSGGAATWNLIMIQADSLWSQGTAGQGVVIAAMDTGVDVNHNALSGSYRGGSNSWFDPNGQHAAPYDANGHGTQTMGVIVGAGGMGVAPQAQWIAVKIFDDSGMATTSGIHSGFQWLLDPDDDPATDDSPDIVNNSWGFNDRLNECYTEFEMDIEALRVADIAVVFAGGNNGPATATSISPANNAGSLAVGALDSGGQVISMSSSGPSACGGGLYPQLTAPGLGIYTADLTYNGIFPDMTTYVSGTSLSAPHVTGAMALLRSVNPTATVAELEQALWDTAQDLGTAGPDNDYGFGLVQSAAAAALLGSGFGGGGGGGTDPPAPQCFDVDDDGFFSLDSDPACGQPVDCADNDPTVYPGATEIVKDGIDQDCNGYDLTIEITRALYKAGQDKVVIFATSDLGAEAALTADIPGIGSTSLNWNNSKSRWQKSIGKAVRKGFDPSNPGNVVVSGPEGDVVLPITIK